MARIKFHPAVLLYAAAAISLLFMLGSLPHLLPDGSRRHHRRLKLRTDFSEASRFAVRFDPLVAEIEMKREDKAWEREHYALPYLDDATVAADATEWGGYRNAEDYVNDEARFNLTKRIEVLFPKIDVDPADGFVTLPELKAWFLRQAEKDKDHRTRRGMELYDKNKDGFVTFEEFLRQSDGLAVSNLSEINSGWFKPDHFRASDMDGDGQLNLTEFNELFHPADSKNPKLISWLCKEEIRRRDKDNDGKLNFEEFYPGLLEFLGGYDLSGSPNSDSSTKSSARQLFVRLDHDNDRFLSDKELEPVIGTFHPSELFFANQQAEHAFKEADADKDGRLTRKEMIDHPDAFYMAVMTNHEYGMPHQEFR